MSTVDHLVELRRRLTIGLLAVLVVSILVGTVLYAPVLSFITHPYCSLPVAKRGSVLPDGSCALVFNSPADAILVRVKIALIAGAVLSSPIWLWQIWRFLAPGLYKKERRYALSFVGSSALLFAGGVTLAYLVLSRSLEALIKYSGPHVVALFDIGKYLSFITTLMLVFGVAFELPLLIAMLNIAGVVHSSTLRKHRRVVIFLLVAFAAIATPTQDPFSMLALALPLIVLYEGAVLLGRVVDRRRDRNSEVFHDLDDDAVSPLDTSPTAPGFEPVSASPAPLASAAPQAVLDPYRAVGDDSGTAPSGTATDDIT